MHVYMYVCMHTCMHVCIRLRTHTHTYTSIHPSIHECMHTYIHTHIYIYIYIRSARKQDLWLHFVFCLKFPGLVLNAREHTFVFKVYGLGIHWRYPMSFYFMQPPKAGCELCASCSRTHSAADEAQKLPSTPNPQVLERKRLTLNPKTLNPKTQNHMKFSAALGQNRGELGAAFAVLDIGCSVPESVFCTYLDQ